MKKTLTAFCLALLVLFGCQREPLHDMAENLELRLDIDLSLDDTTMWVKPALPTVMKTVFYDPQTGKEVSSILTGPTGGKIYGLQPGKYLLLTYNLDTKTTIVKDADDFYTAFAYTDKYEASEDVEYTETRADEPGSTIVEPDHLLVGRDTAIVVPYLTVEDTTFIIHADVKTIHDSYRLIIDSLRGLENIVDVQVFLATHMPSNHFGPDVRTPMNVNLYISTMAVDTVNNYVATNFCTFGKFQKTEQPAKAYIQITGKRGSIYRYERDITDQYLKEDHVLIIYIDDIILPREEGGFIPVVNEWDTIVEDIYLQ